MEKEKRALLIIWDKYEKSVTLKVCYIIVYKLTT